MKYSAITKENVEGFRYLLIPEVAAAIRKGEEIGALGMYDDEGEMPTAVGAIAGIAGDGVFQILSLFVEKKYREQGHGSELFNAYTAQLERFELPLCAEFLSTTEGETKLEKFFLDQGFEEIGTDSPFVRFRLSDLDEEELNLEADVAIDAGFLEELSETELLLTTPVGADPDLRMDPFLSTVLRKAKEQYPEDTEVYAYVSGGGIGGFIGRCCHEPEIVSRKFMRY